MRALFPKATGGSVDDRVIHPYPLVSHGSDYATIAMPRLAEIVHLGIYEGQPAIWAIVDLSLKTELRRFKMVPDGFVVPGKGDYIDTLTMYQGDRSIAMHFFEVPMVATRTEPDNAR